MDFSFISKDEPKKNKFTHTHTKNKNKTIEMNKYMEDLWCQNNASCYIKL